MTGTRDEQWQVAAELREGLRGNKPNDVPAHAHTGLAGDDLTRRLLNHLSTHYDPHKAAEQYDELRPSDMPSTVEETELYQMLLNTEATETLTRSIHNNDPITQSAAIGDPGAESDISGLNAIDKLSDIVGQKAPIVYIMGEPGSGKTNFSLLMSQLWKRQNPDGELLSNIAGWEESDHWIPTFGKLQEVISRNVEETDSGGITQTDDSTPMLFVFDEANQAASGRGAEGFEAAQKLGKLVFLIRKYNCGIVVIGHSGKDIIPTVRELSTVIQRYRRNIKQATVWESIKDREGQGKIMELSGIPETDMTYDDEEATHWSWTVEESEQADQEKEIERKASKLAEEMAQTQALDIAADIAADMDKSSRVEFGVDLYNHDAVGASQRDIADKLGVTQAAISRKVRDNDGDDDDE